MKEPWIFEDDSGAFEVDESMISNGRFIPEKIPDIINGHFYCNYVNLIDLVGSPRRVNGTFNCNETGITSLEGAPEYVMFHFECSDNNLRTLKHTPLTSKEYTRRPANFTKNKYDVSMESNFVNSDEYRAFLEKGTDYWIAFIEYIIKYDLNINLASGIPKEYKTESMINSIKGKNKFNL